MSHLQNPKIDILLGYFHVELKKKVLKFPLKN